MRREAAPRDRFLLFRSYLLLVAGLAVVAALLDYGFGQYQQSVDDPAETWLTGNFLLVETRLASLSPRQQTVELARLSRDLGLPVHIFPTEQVFSSALGSGNIEEAYDDDGQRLFYRTSQVLDAVIQIGPESNIERDELAELIVPLFYLSILVVVGIWLRPLVRDLNLLSNAAEEFATDYRNPLGNLKNATSLSHLAASLEDMTTRIRGLIRGQKDLTNALSHEMRTPLARIKFAMAMIRERGGNGLDEEFDSMDKDVDEIETLIRTMLDYARLDHQDVQVDWQQTPLEEWLEQFQQKYETDSVSVMVAPIESNGSVDLAMDPYLMGIAVSNLLINACRHAASEVVLTVRCLNNSGRILVEDDGPGINEADYDAVFQAFRRLDTSRNRETGGYGLGLAIVARIAALHGGTVEVQRAPLGGASFVLEWPRHGM
ncbi:MAG: ATP-binding protein [Gammaproteobacteria bacterium]|nr:ATP-binding protein [Gammaproteobacteria bacterium]